MYVAVVVAVVPTARGRRAAGRWRRGLGDAALTAARAAVREAERCARRGRFPVIMTILAAALAGGLARPREDVAVVVAVVLAARCRRATRSKAARAWRHCRSREESSGARC